jgi:hypothetical protein
LVRLLIATLVALLVTDDRTPVPGFFDLPVTGGTATLDILGVRPEERGHALALLARQMFVQNAAAMERAAATRAFMAQFAIPEKAKELASEAQPTTVAVPLTAEHWRDVMELPGKADLFPALLSNRSALLLCAGVMATDPSVRSLLERDRGLLRWIMRNTPAAFWIAARALRIEGNRVVVPGGTAAEPIWEAVAAEKVTRPVEFLRAILSRDGGRLAWFYDSVAGMSAERLLVALGTGPIELRIDQARAFYAIFRSADSNWKLEDHPFLRGVTDPWIVSSQIDILPGGALAPPAQHWFWEPLLTRSEVTRRAATEARQSEGAARVSLPWLAQHITEVNAKERRDRFEMIRFAQGVFGNLTSDDLVEAMVALGGYRRYRALLLALDRMEITSPRTYARAVEAARRIGGDNSGRDEKHAVIAFQASLAILERARITRGIDAAAAERLVLSLADLVDPPGGAKPPRAFPAITKWMTGSLVEALPPLVRPDKWTGTTTAYESRFLLALAGPPVDQAAPLVSWEGLDYRVDHSGAEHERLKRIREQIDSPGLDAALEAGDSERICDALLTLIYTPALGDPEGPALLGGDIARRHNFGLDGPAGLRRDQLAWSLPREQMGDGSPWHVEGAILSLDVALARLALRRIADNEMPVAPSINLNDQLTLARTVMVLNPREMRDADRDRLVEAIARGRSRVAAAGSSLADVTALAAEVELSPAIRQTLRWTLTRMPDAAPALFGLRDLMWLGKPDLPAAALDRWGVYAEILDNRLRPAMPAAAPWESFGGRADGGLIATQTPDLALRMAEETARLKLPAELVPGLLTYATQDYWHDVESRFPDDWPAMTRQALALSATRVEDYVAALAGGGPLRPR